MRGHRRAGAGGALIVAAVLLWAAVGPAVAQDAEVDPPASAPAEGAPPAAAEPRLVAPRRIDLDSLELTPGLVETGPPRLRGLMAIDPAAPVPAPVPGAAGPFASEPDEEELFGTEDLERLAVRPEPDAGLERLTLADCVRTALASNHGLADAARSLAGSSSSRRAARAEFIPFVDLVYETRYEESRVGRTRRDERNDGVAEDERTTLRETRGSSDDVEARIGQNLPWGGDVGVTLGGAFSRTETERFDNDANSEREVDRLSVDHEYRSDVALSYDQPLLKGAGWTMGTLELKRAQLGEMREALSYRLRQRDLALEVIQNYYAVIQAELDLAVSREAVDEVQRFMGETRTLFELGRIAESEISRAEIQFLQEKQRFIDRVQALESRIDTLLESLGLPLRGTLTVAPMEGQLIDLRVAGIPPLEEALAEALAQRLEVASSEIGVEEARLSLERAENDLLPQVDASANWVGFDTGDNSDEAADYSVQRRWDVGLSVLVPLPNLQGREARWRARLALETAENQLEEQRRSIVREVKASYRDLQAARARVTLLARTVEQARRSLTLENARFEAGLNTSTEVRNAQDDLFSAQVSYNQALLSLQIELARLYRSLGRPIA